jgi:hypothetical protein
LVVAHLEWPLIPCYLVFLSKLVTRRVYLDRGALIMSTNMRWTRRSPVISG